MQSDQNEQSFWCRAHRYNSQRLQITYHLINGFKADWQAEPEGQYFRAPPTKAIGGNPQIIHFPKHSPGACSAWLERRGIAPGR